MVFKRLLREAFGQLEKAYSTSHNQHDAGEFMTLLLDLLYNAFSGSGQSASNSDSGSLLLLLKNPIRENFEIHLLETANCANCGRPDSKLTFELHLLLPLPNSHKGISIDQLLYDCLTNHRREQKCENDVCNNNFWHRVRLQPLHAPPMLMLSVKRTNYKDGMYLKNDVAIKINKVLTLRILK